MFDSNAMAERAAIARSSDRNSNGGTHTVYATAAAWDKAHGVHEFSKWRQIFREIEITSRERYAIAFERYRFALHRLTLDKDANDEIPF